MHQTPLLRESESEAASRVLKITPSRSLDAESPGPTRGWDTNGHRANPQSGEKLTRQSLEETRYELPRVSSQGSHTKGAYFLQKPAVTTARKFGLPGRLMPRGFSWGSVTRVSSSWRVPASWLPEAGTCPAWAMLLYKQLGQSELLRRWTNGRNLPETQAFRWWARANLASRAF